VQVSQVAIIVFVSILLLGLLVMGLMPGDHPEEEGQEPAGDGKNAT